MLRKKFEERRVTQILFEISSVVQILRIDLRDRQAMFAKVAGEFQESRVLFAHIVENADRTGVRATQADDFAPRSAQLPLQGLNLLHRGVEVLLKEFA